MLRGDKAVIYGGGVTSGAVASAFARAGRAGGADSRGAVAGRGYCDRQCRRSATISWWTSALAGGVFRIPHANSAAHRPEPRAEPTFPRADVLVRISACSGRS